jgi:hypothetical protein
MKSIWFVLSALFFVLSAFRLPPVSSLAIPPCRGRTVRPLQSLCENPASRCRGHL